MKNIALVGFMGTGKTVVGKALALDLNMEYVSVDKRIEERENRAIKDIFRDDGEQYFRRVEKSIVKEISGKTHQVIDTGGGVVLDSENMELLQAGGVVVCLWADPETIHRRTSKHGHRPLLNVDNPLERIEELLEDRRSFYEKAEIHIDTAEVGVDAVVALIKRLVADEQ